MTMRNGCRTLRVLALGVLVHAAVALQAQAAPRIRFGVVAGPQLTELTLSANDAAVNVDHGLRVAGFGGIVAEYPLSRHWSLVPGIEYGEIANQNLEKVTLAVDTSAYRVRIEDSQRLRMLSVPIRLQWRSGPVRVSAGPEWRLLLHADQRWAEKVTYPGSSVVANARGRRAGPAAQIFELIRPNGIWYDATDAYRRSGIAAQFACGVDVPHGSHALRADLRWSEGLSDVSQGYDRRARAVQFAFGALW